MEIIENCFFCSLLTEEVHMDVQNPVNTDVKYTCMGNWDTDIPKEIDGVVERSKARKCCCPSLIMGLEYDPQLKKMNREDAFNFFKRKYIKNP